MDALANKSRLPILNIDVMDAGRGAMAAIRMARTLATKNPTPYLERCSDANFTHTHAALDLFSEAAEALGIRWWEVEP